MKTVQVRDAAATFPTLVEAAAQGEPTIITRNGAPVAVLAPFEDGRRLYPERADSFADFLMSFPGGLDLERDVSPILGADL